MRRALHIIERSLTMAKENLHAYIKMNCLLNLGPFELTLTNMEGDVVGCNDVRCVKKRCGANGGDALE